MVVHLLYRQWHLTVYSLFVSPTLYLFPVPNVKNAHTPCLSTPTSNVSAPPLTMEARLDLVRTTVLSGLEEDILDYCMAILEEDPKQDLEALQDTVSGTGQCGERRSGAEGAD